METDMKRNLIKGGLIAVAVTSLTLLAPVLAQAQTVLKMAHIYIPGNIWYETAEAYAKAVEARTAGKVKIQIAHSGSTGDWPQAIEALKIGTNDIVLQSVGTLDRYNIIAGIEAYPYLVRDVDHFKKVYYGPMGSQLYDEIAAKTQFRIIGAGYRGARHLSSNKKVEKVEDLKGVKLRVPPLKMYRMTWEFLGASPTPMGIAELFTSLQNGVVDGQENPLEVLEQQKYYEVQKYLVETGHQLASSSRYRREVTIPRRLAVDKRERLRPEFMASHEPLDRKPCIFCEGRPRRTGGPVLEKFERSGSAGHFRGDGRRAAAGHPADCRRTACAAGGAGTGF